MPKRLAYLPLPTYPEPAPDEAILAVARYAAALGLDLHASAFAVELPRVGTRLPVDIPGMVRAAETQSRAECDRLAHLLSTEATSSGGQVRSQRRTVAMGLAGDAAAEEARYFDVTLLPWSKGDPGAQELAKAIVFASGRPAILVPAEAASPGVRHVAVGWDGSRTAARALGDALGFMSPDTRVTVVTVHGEKALSEGGAARLLAESLEQRGLTVATRDAELGGRSIGAALQAAAVEAGAELLVMGGYGHSRFRDFVLGGATRDVLADLRLPVLVSH